MLLSLFHTIFLRCASIVCLVIFLAVFTVGQAGSPAQNTANKLLDTPPAKSTAAAKQPAKIKLTPDQEKALHLLDEAEASAPTLQPGMHAFILFEVAKTYEKFDKGEDQRFNATSVPGVAFHG